MLNLKIYFGDDIHDYPENPEDINKFIELEKIEIPNLPDDEKYKRISQLAVYLRLLAKFDESHQYFKLAAVYFEKKNPKMNMINLLRWADVFRFEKKFDQAFDLLKKSEKIIAAECFEVALLLRQKKNDADLILSTELALRVVRSKIW